MTSQLISIHNERLKHLPQVNELYKKNGFSHLCSYPQNSVDLVLPSVQAVLHDRYGHIIREIYELDQELLLRVDTPKKIKSINDEFADVIIFLHDITYISWSNFFTEKPQYHFLSQLDMGSNFFTSWQDQEYSLQLKNLMTCIVEQCKNKPWKKTQRDLNVPLFRERLKAAWEILIKWVVYNNPTEDSVFTDKTLFNIYYSKQQYNLTRAE